MKIASPGIFSLFKAEKTVREETTQPLTPSQTPGQPPALLGLKYQLARRVLSGDDSAGGVLILSRWKSALLQKFSLFERSEFGNF